MQIESTSIWAFAHAPFSAVDFMKLSVLGNINYIDPDVKPCCKHSEHVHDLLLPYFCDDLALKYEYDRKMKEEVRKYYRIQYQQLQPVAHGSHLAENQWSRGLTDSLQRMFDFLDINHKAKYVGDKGAEFDHFQSEYSGLEELHFFTYFEDLLTL